MDDNCCGTCKFHHHDSAIMHKGDYVCVNPESEYCSDYTMYDDYCMDYESREDD